MTRLIVVVEGQTEEPFVKDVLVGHLANHGVFASVTIVGKVVAQERDHSGRGGGSFGHWFDDIQRTLGDPRKGHDLRVTTLFDLYGLPTDFPEIEKHHGEPDTRRRCELLEQAMAEKVNDRRFIPYIQLHEFEALVLAALPSLRDLLDVEDDLRGLDNLVREVGGLPPEEVNDGENTAPSKRLLRHVPGYSKTLHGPLATYDAGLATLRNACPRFGAWIERLEQLG
jgi:hypothetical protein